MTHVIYDTCRLILFKAAVGSQLENQQLKDDMLSTCLSKNWAVDEGGRTKKLNTELMIECKDDINVL